MISFQNESWAKREFEMTEENKNGSSAKTKLLIGAVVVLAIITVVAIGLNLFNPASQTGSMGATEVPEVSGDDSSAHSDMDFDAMFEASVQENLELLINDPNNLEACLEAADTYYMWVTYITDRFFTSTHNQDELFLKALEYYQFALDIEAENIKAIMGMGYTCFDYAQYMSSSDKGTAEERNKRYQDAITYFDMLLDHDNVDSYTEDEITNTLVNKSIALFALGETDEAIALLEDRKVKDANHVRLYINLGVYYEAQENIDAATECYDTAIALAKEQDETDLAATAEKRKSALG